ncbi:MAG: T9SS type A sorting domain-containing protein [Bacteroidota bacterium]
MKTMMRCLVVLGLITVSNAQWVKTNGYGVGGNITFFYISGTTLFAGTDDGIYRSTDNGTQWSAVNTGLTNIQTLYVSGVYIFAGTSGGAFISTNNGSSWTAINGVSGEIVSAFVVSGTNLFVGTSVGGVYVSTNNGSNWTAINNGLINKHVLSLFISGTNLFAGTDLGVFLSTDYGASWTLRNTGLTHSVNAIMVSGSNLIAGSYDGVYLSQNDGLNWTKSSTGALYVNTFIACDNCLFSGSYYYGVSISTNNGSSWMAVNNGLPQYEPYKSHVSALAANGTNLFVGTVGDGVFLSSNNGADWISVSSGLPLKPLPTVNTFAVSGSNLFAGTTGCVYRTTNKGADWTKLNNGLPVNKSVRSLVSIGTNLFAGTDSGVYVSSNNGANWTDASSGLTILEVKTLSASGTNLLAGTAAGVFLSTNNGAKWSKTTLDTVTVTSFAVNGTNLFAGTNKGLFLSVNNGVNWNYLGFIKVSLVYVLPVKADSAIIFVSWIEPTGTDEGNEVFSRSMNNGGSWVRVEYIFPSSMAHSGTTLFAGITRNFATSNNSNTVAEQKEFGGSIFCSNDYGNSWTGVDTGFSYVNSAALAVFGDNLFAGPRCYDIGNNFPGVWRRPLSEMITDVKQSSSPTPEKYSLSQNYPNPFNPSTTLRFSIPERSTVRLSIFNTLGQKISEIVNEVKEAGSYEHSFNASLLASGIYFYRIEVTSVTNSKTFVNTKKMVLMR